MWPYWVRRQLYSQPWSMIWGRVCLCGPLWPLFVTLWWASSSSSSLSSSTRHARCLHTKRKCQFSHRSRSRRIQSRSTCWTWAVHDLKTQTWDKNTIQLCESARGQILQNVIRPSQHWNLSDSPFLSSTTLVIFFLWCLLLSYKLFASLHHQLHLICAIQWSLEKANCIKSCGKTNNNKRAQSSYLCCVPLRLSICLFTLLYTDLLLYSIRFHLSI